MNELPPVVQERLRALAEQFAAAFPQRLADIRELASRAEAGNLAALRELRNRVHRIAGSAATFGYDALTRSARAVEALVERDLASDAQQIQPPTLAALARLAEVRVGGSEESEASSATANGISLNHAIVLGEPSPLDEETIRQMEVFGFGVVRVAEIGDIGLDDLAGDEERRTLIVGTVSYFAERTARLRALAALRDQAPGRVAVLMIGDEDDFEVRLRSVRYGADAFLAAPVEPTSMVDIASPLVENRTEPPYHILIIDDDPDQVSVTALALQDAGMITSVVTDPTNIFRVLVEYKPELILMDMYMPACSGIELASIIRQNASYVSIPIVFLSVEKNMEKQLAAIRSGGDDFLTKPIDPTHLVTSVRVRAQRTRAMRYFMERDSLTGLLNHTHLKQRLEDEVGRARRMGTEISFVMIDLDRFKSVNDTYGHLTGDRVLRSLSRLLQDRLRRTDIVGRYGGEEFGVILFGTAATQAAHLMDRIRESFSQIVQVSGDRTFSVTMSCGVAEFPTFDDVTALNEAADGALYTAKETGRNRIVIASPES